MNTLETIQSRIKYSRLFTGEKNGIRRLYIPYGKNGKGIKTAAWFEVVNDRLQVFCRVENDRNSNYYDNQQAANYKAEIERQFHELINNCELERKKVPLHERLKDDVIPVYDSRSKKHQVDALRFMCSMKVSALYADTGTMKSKIVIDLVQSRYEAGQIKKVLVFLPVSTKKNFRDQIHLWCNTPGIYWKLIGIESMSSSDKTVFEALEYADNETQIIVDESHMVKTPIAKRSKRIKMVCDKSSYKVVMTGTPVTENVHNLYMQYAMLSELIIGVRNWLKFEEKYLIMGGRNGDEIIGYKNLDQLMGLLEPYTYQVSKEEVLDLPAKTETAKYCYLTDEQEEYYQAEKERLLTIIERDEMRAIDIFEVFTHMQQITSGYHKTRDGKITILESNKPLMLKNLDFTQPTVFFCKYIFEIETIINYLGRENCAVFTGRNPKDRDNELQLFRERKRLYFVATMQSGGTGLNGLQEVSSQVVFYSNSFSYLNRKQSVGRIDRPGQTKPMLVIDLLTHSGIDTRIMGNLRRKGNLTDEIKELMKNKTKLKKYIELL
jgi:hypothetical protein